MERKKVFEKPAKGKTNGKYSPGEEEM